MINYTSYSKIDPELCVGQKVTSANEILSIINRLAESAAQTPENPLQNELRKDRKTKVKELIGKLVQKIKGLFKSDDKDKEDITYTETNDTIVKLQENLTEAEQSPKQEMGNYGVAALIIDKRSKMIVAAGKNSIARNVYHGGELNPKGDDGHAEVNALRAFFKKKAKALDAAKNTLDPGTGQPDPTALTKVETDFATKNYELWVNLCPCQMCAGAIRICGMSAVFVAPDPVVAPYEHLYKDAPIPGAEIARLIHQVDKRTEKLFDAEDKNTPAAELCDDANRVFDTTAEAVRTRKTQIGQKPHHIINIAAYSKGTEHERDVAKQVISAIHAVSNESNGENQNIFTALSGDKHCEEGLIKGNKDTHVAPDSISEALELYLEKSAIAAKKNGNKPNAAIAIDPNGVPWFCTNDRTSTRNPLRTPIMRLLRRIEKVRAQAGEEIASYMPLPSEFTIVSLMEPNDMEAIRMTASSVKNLLYLKPDEENGVISTRQVEKMTDLYKVRRGLDGAIRPVQSRTVSIEQETQTQWRKQPSIRPDPDDGKAALGAGWTVG